jgi:nicotinamide-nucleotide amidase
METAELVSTGNELLSGRTVNRHARLLGSRLGDLGIRLVRDTTVGDDLSSIVEAVRSALDRSGMVFVSGGLGPTPDDLTRDALAALLGRRLVTDPVSLQRIRERYEAFNRRLTSSAERQACIIQGAAVLQNPVGVAPGQRIEVDRGVIFVLPGPPAEFESMLDEHILPWLSARSGAEAARTPPGIFMVCGVGESDIVARLEPRGFPPEGIDVAFCAAPGRVEIRLSGSGGTASLQAAAQVIREELGEAIFAEERISMEACLAGLLSDPPATVATAESCTGGLIGHRITSVAGSSRYYVGGIVAYANEAKIKLLGVRAEDLNRYGAVSEPVARQMAEGVRSRFDAEFGLSTTGIAGPDGGTVEKPVGTVFIGLADREHAWVRSFRFPGSRPNVKEWTCQMSLDLLRRRLLGLLAEDPSADRGGAER